ncbi:MAG: hypothetical protein HC825_04870 [Oscillatoriales cyanobacterium RM1_1_9]|nr:hypothetical protein [Oscillatoriales cyanobacterium SM2_3_0]NJO44206.1 hypothetical protein [Oscillatoriales cyanobacterium RM2_1_1]NJO71206.1 hypothetical protein [Oscillatoriales cyanobacterium RM1_1_9]
MSHFPSFIRSLFLTMILSFLAPILLIHGGLVSFVLVAHLPMLDTSGEICSHRILEFLAIFGNGQPWLGTVIIGTTFSLVGSLFDTYASFQHQRSS